MSKPKVSPIQRRRAPLLVQAGTGRRMSAALSSNEPVDRVFGIEHLVHEPDAIDFSRAAGGLPLLVNHDDRSLPIGRVENVRLDGDKRLRGDLLFSEATKAAREAFALVEDGTLSQVSIAYRVLDWKRGDKEDEITVTRWMPIEASVVSVAADPTIGIGRGFDHPPPTEHPTMPPETPKLEAGNASVIADVQTRSNAARTAGADAERTRLNEIVSLAASLTRSLPAMAAQIETLAETAREDGTITPDRFRSLALDLIGGNTEPLNPMPSARDAGARTMPRPGNAHRGMSISAGADSRDQIRSGMELALYQRAGGKVDANAMQGNQFRGWSLFDLAERCAREGGIDTRGMSREQIAKYVIQHSNRAIEGGAPNLETSDFPAVTSNVAHKFIFDGFAAADVTWDQWCSEGSAPDFKVFDVPRLSAFTSLPVVAESGAYQEGLLVDAKESGALIKHGLKLSLSWEAVVNDDLGMFNRNAYRLGEAANRTVDEQVYATILLNQDAGPPIVGGPVMGDTEQLFDSVEHLNVGTAALDLPGVVASRVALARQTDENSVLLGIKLAHILVPVELEDAANNLANSEYLPWDAPTADGGAPRMNTVRSTFTPIATARLTDVNDWFALARKGSTVEVVFLNGQREPTVEQEMGWSFDTLDWKVRHVFDVLPVDWRGLRWNKVT